MKAAHLVVAVGTGLTLLGAMRPEQTMSVTASAYNSAPAQTDENQNQGARRDLITPGMQVIAVSPDLIDAGLTRGTELRLEGLPGTSASTAAMAATFGRTAARQLMKWSTTE